LPVSRIEFEVGYPQGRAEQVPGPPQLRFQPGDQLFERERLHEIIVRTAAQALDTVVKAAARGQYEDGNRIVEVPYLA
jgi:hypothetical protein